MKARSKDDLTTSTDHRFGPWRPMRGARAQAEAIQQEVDEKPRRTHETAGRIDPGRYDTVRRPRK